jgi:GntR family transcriptional regulator
LRASLYYGSASPMTNPGRPVYLRLRDEICAGILAGRYPEGTMLPSVRAFAAEQGANPLTVAKAYQQFQDEGFVTVQRGIGMSVAAGAVEALRQRERESFLTEEWPAIAERMNLLGLKLGDLTELA